MTNSADTWVTEQEDSLMAIDQTAPGIVDVHSGSSAESPRMAVLTIPGEVEFNDLEGEAGLAACRLLRALGVRLTGGRARYCLGQSTFCLRT